jgi:hypothetical protein
LVLVLDAPVGATAIFFCLPKDKNPVMEFDIEVTVV